MDNYQLIEKGINYISNNVDKQPKLDEIAKYLDISSFHFQKIFSEWAGVSPKKFLQYLTLKKLKENMKEESSILDLAIESGLSSQSRVYDLFINIEAMTPNEYKKLGENIDIEYGYHSTIFGECFIAITKRGVCKFSFISIGETKEECLINLKKNWSKSNISENNVSTLKVINRMFNHRSKERFNLLVKGTNFQIKVWEALIKIPISETNNYQEIAGKINNIKAVRAVGTAVAKNPIGFLIPCHRVIRKAGNIGNYHWGSDRKRALLYWESIVE